MKIKMIALVCLAIFLFATSNNVQAVDEVVQSGTDSDFKGETKMIADVKIRNAEISEIKKNHLKLFFEVENMMEIQSDMVYGIELLKKIGENKFILSDIQIFQDDRITVEKGNLVKREIIYQAPEHLSGDYVLWLKFKDESGLILSMRPFNVNLSGTEAYIDQGNSCFLTIEGETDKKYSLIQGVDLKKEERLFFECQAKNLTEESVVVLPSFEFYQRDSYGKKIKEYEAQANGAIVFAGNEEKMIKLPIDFLENPQAYDVKIILKKDGLVFSNPVIAHFVLSGKSGTIINASLDKSSYGKGETAQLILLWAGSADTFLDSRTGGSFLSNPKFEVEFKDVNGVSCGEKTINQTGGFETILSIPLEKDCVYPIITARLVDEGQVLYEKIISTEPEKEEKQPEIGTDKEEGGNVNWMLLGALILVMIIGISGLVYWKMRKEYINKISLWIFIILASFFLAHQAEAGTTLLSGPGSWMTGNQAIMYGANFVPFIGGSCGVTTPTGASIYTLPLCPAVESARTVTCRVGPNVIFEVAPVHLRGYWGCYQDKVAFYYELYNMSGVATSNFNQGDTIAMGGSFTPINVCSNGITGNMSVKPRSTDPTAQYLISLWTNDSSNHGGTYYANTGGWSCSNYLARFYFNFSHVVTTSGLDDISYSVNNCCSNPTCATGPGCRASLTNGSVTSGTCCSGSCYQCNAGYYWNTSACVIDCSIWSASLNPSPASGPAPLTVNLAVNVGGVVSGETYLYSNRSCGVGGPAPTNINGANFTCVYPSNGTFTPSVRVTAQSTGCVKTPSTTVTVSAVAITNNAQCVSVTGVPATIAPGGTFSAQVTMRNIGTKTWNSDASPHRLGSASPQDNLNWGLNRINLPVASVAQNSQTTFTVNATAPATAGTYNFDWRMVEDSIEWFGPVCSGGPVTVTSGPIPTLIFSASPSSVALNGTSTLTWAPTNATSCWASGDWTGWKTNTGNTEITPALIADKTYNLECWNAAGTSTGLESATVTVSAAAITNNAQCVSVTGVPATIAPGGTFSAQVTMMNIGTKTWNSDATPHRLGSTNLENNLNWGLNRINLPVVSVAQNSQTTFTINATAPATAGTYNFDWRMVEDFVEWFGPVCSGVPVTVASACIPCVHLSNPNPCLTCGTQPNMPFCFSGCPGGCSSDPWCSGTTYCGACSSGKWIED